MSELHGGTIAHRLHLARINATLSQGQAAKRLGMHRPTISQIEANKRRVTAEELITFSELYGVSVSWLLGLSPEKSKGLLLENTYPNDFCSGILCHTLSRKTMTEPTTQPLSEPQIDYLVRQYLREVARFEKAALYVMERIRRALRAEAINHLASFRAKRHEELRGKLKRKASDPRYQNLVKDHEHKEREELDRVVTDLAGCRIVVYDPADEERVAQVVKNVLAVASIKNAVESHSRDSGYKATHILVEVPENEDTYSTKGTICEVQVTSLASHLFNELEHDIRYKEHGVSLKPQEDFALDSLRDELRLVEATTKRLLRLRATNISQSNEPIQDPEALRYVLGLELGLPLRGNVEALFRFLLTSLQPPLNAKSINSLGKPAALIKQGRELAEKLVLAETDDVVYYVLGLFPDFGNELSEWAQNSPEISPTLKQAIQKAERPQPEEKKDA
jgi:ppGpp synthetase/RelA/SpoT-type nucleotidyltranferase/DNA-binding XRE family transcriptional regulator